MTSCSLMHTGTLTWYSPHSRRDDPWRHRTIFKLIFNVSRGNWGLQVLTNESGSVFVHVQSDDEEAIFLSQVPTISALTKGCKSAKVVRDLKDIPAGCGSSVLTPTVAVHVLVRVSQNKQCRIARSLIRSSGLGGSRC